MTLTEQIVRDNAVPWFQSWFDSVHYHKLYGNRNEKEASDFIDVLIDYLQPDPGSSMLDLGCGAGRHSKHLSKKGYPVTGIDLSSSSIRAAKKWETESLQFIRRDMRDPFGTRCFDYIFNFFTSFGYFKTDYENHLVIRNIANALKDYGTVVMDFMNTNYVEERLVGQEQKEIDGIQYGIYRWVDEKFICKKIVIDEGMGFENVANEERVARFGLDDFKKMFRANGLMLESVFGDYHLCPFDLKTSPRLVMVARKIE